MKEKITNVFLKHKLLPDQDGIYRSPDELSIAVPFSLADQRKSLLWQESFVEGAHFVAFNDENASKFTEYFNWLKDDLRIRIFDMRQWVENLCELSVRSIELSGAVLEDIEKFYSFLWDYDSRSMKYLRATSYEAVYGVICERHRFF